MKDKEQQVNQVPQRIKDLELLFRMVGINATYEAVALTEAAIQLYDEMGDKVTLRDACRLQVHIEQTAKSWIQKPEEK